MRERLKHHLSSAFFKNFYIVLSGSVMSQVVVVFTTPILSRIFSPEDFGSASVFFSLSGFFTILSTLQFEGAIMLPKRNIDAIALVVLASGLSVISAVLLFFGLWVGHETFLGWFHMESLNRFWALIPISVLIYAHYAILTNWVTRLGQYKTVAYRQFFQSLSQTGTKIILGKLSYLTTGLILGTIMGVVSSLFILMRGRYRDAIRIFKLVKWNRIKRNAKRYEKFPKYTLSQGLLDTFQESILWLMISVLYGNQLLGIFSFTLSLLQKPLQVIGNSLGQVYYQDISKKFAHHQEIHSDTLRLVKLLALAAGVVYLPIVWLGPWLFDLFFGDVWRESGELAQLMAIWLMLKMISSPISSVPNVTGHQGTYFSYTLIMNLIPLIIFFGGYLLGINFHRVVMMNYIVLTAFLVFYIRWILQLTRLSINRN
jgi:O-antigen/teichoic acid export membrane protein